MGDKFEWIDWAVIVVPTIFVGLLALNTANVQGEFVTWGDLAFVMGFGLLVGVVVAKISGRRPW